MAVPFHRGVRGVSPVTAPALPGPGTPGAAATTGVLGLPGARLAYQVTGDGPAVVLVHGFGLDMRMWDDQAEHLAARYQVIRYDCRGFGSSGPFDPAAACAHAGDLLALLDHLGVGQAVPGGLSSGGRTARLAHPLFAAARGRPEVSKELAAMVAAYPGQRCIGHDPHEQAGPRPADVLEKLAMPVLVMAGEHDVPGSREMSAALARRIPGARYHVVAGAGHMVTMEQPAAVNEMLTRFLDELPPLAAAQSGTGDAQWNR
jgi:3-oxoadipate enol-lactonase